MFTGIVAALGRIIAIDRPRDGLRLRIDAASLEGEALQLGESIAVSGVCLTVTGFREREFDCDVSAETLRLTTLGRVAIGDSVNLERALRAGDRLGGHLVSGHVDGIGHLRAQAQDGLARVYTFDVPDALRRYLAIKGSIAVDGTSLTINTVDAEGFSVHLIPHTLEHTTLGTLHPGAPVNLEVDQVARYVERLLHSGGVLRN